MRCNLSLRQLAPVLAALGLLLYGAAALAVQLSISSATVAQPGGDARVCVSLTTGGQEVAGTQNDLVWDGTCMSLNDGACFAAGNHGKQVNTRIQNSADFRMRVLVLSLSDVDPIDDGVLYCCNVQGEAPAGSCCSISVVNTGASDSQGTAIAGVGGNTGRLCTQGGGSSGGGAVGSVTGSGNQMAGNGLGTSDGGAAGGMDGSMGGSGAQAPPANQVLQGGGGGVQVPAAPVAQPAAPVLPAAPVASAPTPLAFPTRAAAEPPAPVAPAAAGAPAAPAAPAPASAPATLAATALAAPPTAAPTAADTATAARPTPVPPTKAPASTPTAPRATPSAKRGWFGCQIADGASAAPALAFALVLAALVGVRRRRPPHR